ncbi:MAG: adenylate/guanylate cyclase domain-containing protein [Mycobacterium sp.]
MDRSGDGGGGLTARGLVCASCGAQSSPTAKYCGECGTPLTRATRAAEYKQVTVLFADVVHSMDIAAAVGPERLREIMAELANRCAAVVQRFGGTVDKFTGDGIMAVFGAPAALEDHALRACLAALAIQEEAKRLAVEVQDRDRIELQLRIGLNSGEVIAGEFGSGPFGYTTIGEQVGMAQRIESAAPPGGVMLSESTARLVEDDAHLAEPQMVKIKGADAPVRARQLLAVAADQARCRRRESRLIGRQQEMRSLEQMLDQAINGHGCVAGVKGLAGVGKSRLIREATAIAEARGVAVISTFCQSHSKEIPFHAVGGLLRDFFGVGSLGDDDARTNIRTTLPSADQDDVVLLEDLLGIRDAEHTARDIDPDARRRRLTNLLTAALLARREPVVYIVEDAHWIDAVSESMVADFISVVPQTHAVVLITYRPEYHGVIGQTPASTTISLAALDHSETAALTAELLGPDPSVAEVAARVAERGAGNPFFTEEIVRDLAERNILEGRHGAYVCPADIEVTVPATVQATIAARIDRLGASAKRTLNTASVIGSRFGTELLTGVLGHVALTELVDAELIEEITTSPPEYGFRHPLIHAVAYESQLKSERSHLHREMAAAVEKREPAATDKNAALIATHLEAAGDLARAFEWHMRAGAWSTHRDITGARMSWERARQVADRLPAEDARRMSMRIAPRTLLCATIWRVGGSLDDIGFDELRELATAAGDKRSLAIGMTGLVQMLNFYGEYAKAARLASDHVELLESIGDPELTVGLLMVPMIVKWSVGEVTEAMGLSQCAIDASQGDPTMGNLIVGSPLAFALVMRASARCALGIPGWREDFDDAIAIARRTDKFTFCAVVMFKYIATQSWVLLPGDGALRDTADALEIAKQFGDNFTLTNAEFTRGVILVRRDDTDRKLGFELLDRARRLALDHRNTIVAAWCVDIDVAAEKNRIGDYDGAIDLCRAVLQNEIRGGEMTNRGWCTTVLVEALLNRGRDEDLDEAQKAIDRLAATPTDPGFLYHELPLLRLTAMLAKARGDEGRYCDFRERYRARAESSGFEGHIALARAMG